MSAFLDMSNSEGIYQYNVCDSIIELEMFLSHRPNGWYYSILEMLVSSIHGISCIVSYTIRCYIRIYAGEGRGFANWLLHWNQNYEM